VIPDDALLQLSLRATNAATAHDAYRRIVTIATAIAEAYGLRVRNTLGPALGPTVSDPAGADLVRQTVVDLLGAEHYEELSQPEMISEDFSLFLERTGGAFVLVGAAEGDGGPGLATNHSPQARFDDSVVPRMANLFAELAVRKLAQS
jgi:hippurate hydrolase